MTIKEIIEKTNELCELRQELKEIRNSCPHVSQEYNWAIVNGVCPYCRGSIRSKEDKI